MLDEELKKHRKKLEKAINRVLTEAPEIRAAIQDIREEGYETFLIVEATIGFNRQDENGLEDILTEDSDLELSTNDHKFLRSLKISPE
jgi:hypothetical protein